MNNMSEKLISVTIMNELEIKIYKKEIRKNIIDKSEVLNDLINICRKFSLEEF